MLTFMLVVLILFLIPGPAVLLTITQTIRGGRTAGIMTGVGIATGDLIHTIAAVLGLSAILLTSSFAFEMIKYLGAAYLFYLGVTAFLEKPTSDDDASISAKKHLNPVASFRQAVLIESLNPKTALFFVAFLPQFVRSDGLPIVYQLLILGLTFVLMSVLYTSMLAIVVSFIGTKLFKGKKTRMFSRWQGKIVGLVYIGLCVKLSFESQK